MMNKSDKPFKYVFSETSIESFKKKPEDNLIFSELVNLVQTVNYQIKYLNNESVVISKYTKDGKLIHTEKIELPVSEHTDFEALLVKFEQTKPPKPTKENEVVSEDSNKKSKKDKPKFQQLSIQSVTMIGFTVLTVCVLGTGFTINHSINQANKQQSKLSQELLLSQLEAGKKYDKVALKMKEFDYPKKEITTMYIENWQFKPALIADKNTLDDVIKKIETLNNDKQKEYFNWIKKSDLITKEQSSSIDLRLALLNKDTDTLKKNIKNIDNQDLADKVVQYLSSEKVYDTAKNILKDFPNKGLEKQVKEADKSNQKKQLEAKLNDAKKSVSDTQKQLDGKNKQISDLHKQLDDINKGNDKDKGKHAEDKQKEIDNANKDKNKISDTLKDLQGKEKEAQKALDDFNKK